MRSIGVGILFLLTLLVGCHRAEEPLPPDQYVQRFAEVWRTSEDLGDEILSVIGPWRDGEEVDLERGERIRANVEAELSSLNDRLRALPVRDHSPAAKFRAVWFDSDGPGPRMSTMVLDLVFDAIRESNPGTHEDVERLAQAILETGTSELLKEHGDRLASAARECGVDWYALLRREEGATQSGG